MKIRTAIEDDAAAIAAIYAPIVLQTTISFEWVPPTADEIKQRIGKTLKKYPWLVAVDDSGAVAGFVYAGSHRDAPSYQWSVNTSVYVREDCRGQGIGRTLYTELLRQLRALGYYRAFAGIALPNERSIALHESVGFRPLGVYEKVGFKFGAWRDVGWWQCAIQPPVEQPQAPSLPAEAGASQRPKHASTLCAGARAFTGRAKALKSQPQHPGLPAGCAMSFRMLQFTAGPPAHCSEQDWAKRARLRSSPRSSASLARTAFRCSCAIFKVSKQSRSLL